MKINKNKVGIIVAIVVMIIIGAYIDGQNRLINEAKVQMEIQNKNINIQESKIEMQNRELEDEKNYRSEIETIKADTESNKQLIVKNKEYLEEAKQLVLDSKSDWEQSVWLGRCLEKKLVDLTILCNENLEKFANWGK